MIMEGVGRGLSFGKVGRCGRGRGRSPDVAVMAGSADDRRES